MTSRSWFCLLVFTLFQSWSMFVIADDFAKERLHNWHAGVPEGVQRTAGRSRTTDRHESRQSRAGRGRREFPANVTLHLVIDNYGTHKHPEVKSWLQRHPRFVVHFVPTSCSWLNLIERWFRELTTKRIRRDSFPSVPDLIAAINEFLEAWNDQPRPFVWTATVEAIVEKLSGCRQTLEEIQPGCTSMPKRKARKLSS